MTKTTPTTRLLALATLILVAGVLCLRAMDLFTQSPAAPAGSPQEQTLTRLLEPVVGAGNVRVSVHTARDKAQSILVLVNGERPPQGSVSGYLADIRPMIEAATGFTTGRDSLTVTQLPFAPGQGGQLSPLEALELLGLILIGTLVLVLLALSKETRTETLESASRPAQPYPAQIQVETNDPQLDQAANLANTRPDDTVKLLRLWMSDTKRTDS